MDKSKDSKVVVFPKRRTQRVIEARRTEGKQALGALSIVSLILVAIFANEQILKSDRPLYIVSDNTNSQSLQNLNRAIASAKPLNPLRDIEWEHKLARKLKNTPDIAERTQVAFGRQPSAIDKIGFEQLADDYRMTPKMVDGVAKIESFEFSPSDYENTVARPKRLQLRRFLEENRAHMVVKYSEIDDPIEQPTKEGKTKVYVLRNEAGQAVGKAVFILDLEDHVLKFSFAQE